MTEETVSDTVAANVREARKRRGWKPADLAARCAEIGAPGITENVLENIESGRRGPDGERRRYVTVDELLALASALDMPPAALLPGLVPESGGVIAVSDLNEAIERLTEIRDTAVRSREARSAKRTRGGT